MSKLINSIFLTEGVFKNSGKHQKFMYNREQLLRDSVAQELNTYLNFGVFPVPADTQAAVYEKVNDKYERTKNSKKSGTPGVRSLFNRAGAVLLGSNTGSCQVDLSDGKSGAHWWRLSNNVPLLDSPYARRVIRNTSGCSVRELVEDSQKGLMGQETYAYSDFMYCKHLGKMSNNYMVTLRRFPLPVDDYIGAEGIDETIRSQSAAKNASCIGCMVTWMGVSGNNLSEILKYNYNMPFKEESAQRQDSKMDADQNQTILNGMFSAFDDTYRKQYMEGFAGEALNNLFEFNKSKFSLPLGNPPYHDHLGFEDSTKVYGPVDTIRDTYVRKDEGLSFTQNITLVFEYELRSYNGINGKQAMLDLISNILNVTYTTGSFWGGGYKGFGAHQSNIFANLNIFKAKGGFVNFLNAGLEDVQNIGTTILQDMKLLNPDNSWKGWGKDTVAAIFNFLNQAGGMLAAGMLNKLGRPQKVKYNSLLSPAPIGFWHLTIGNPKRPIMSIGNMVITECSVEHQGPLGLDDFPTGLKVSITLSRGKPRDLRDIERLYLQGNDRIYTSMGEKVFDMYRNSEKYKEHKKNNDLKNYITKTNLATVDAPIASDNAESKSKDASEKNKVTVTVSEYETFKNSMKKYFGTDDEYSIYIPAAEQEFGSVRKKPSTQANPNLAGGDGSTAPAKTGTVQSNIKKPKTTPKTPAKPTPPPAQDTPTAPPAPEGPTYEFGANRQNYLPSWNLGFSSI